MTWTKSTVFALLTVALFWSLGNAQQSTPSVVSTTVVPNVVPHLVNFSGKAADVQGRAISGIAGITFAIYKEQYEGSPLWLETQNVQADAKGNYSVQLGATKSEGLPLDLFSSGEARWLGVRLNGEQEQARVLLLSVPYALKAADAETLGGLPASAFAMATPASNSKTMALPSASVAPPASSDVTTTGGMVNTLPLFTTGTNIQSSALTQTGTGANAKIGVGTTTPVATLDVKGPTLVRGTLGVAAIGNATAAGGKNSQPMQFTASTFNSGTSAAMNQNLRWQAEPAGTNTVSPSVTLNFLYGIGTATPVETGLKIASNGQITFAPGQTFPGGGGSITGVTAGADLTGGGSSGNVTLSLDTTKVPLLKRPILSPEIRR